MFAWNVPLVSPTFLNKSLIFPILLFTSISLLCSLKKVFLSLLAILWNSASRWYIFPFLLCFLLLFLSHLFVRSSQKIICLVSFVRSWAEFQRITRRDKKAFLSDQCKEIEENSRKGKTRDVFKKIRDTKGTFHAKMVSIKDRNVMDLTEARRYKE